MKKSELFKAAILILDNIEMSIEIDDHKSEAAHKARKSLIVKRYIKHRMSKTPGPWKQLESKFNVRLTIERRPYGFVCLVINALNNASLGTVQGQGLDDLYSNILEKLNTKGKN